MAGLSAIFADYNGPLTGDLTQMKTFNPGISVGAHAYVSSWFNVSLHSAFFPEVVIPQTGGEFAGSSLTDITALTQVKFNNGRLLPESSFIAPYLTTGFGLNMASGSTGYFVPAGLGMKVRVSKNFSLQFESLYKYGINSQAQHIAHTAGFVFALPSDQPVRKKTSPQKAPSRRPIASNSKPQAQPLEKDSDGDGVPDHRDHCPDVKGISMYLGCLAPEEKPAKDTDGDGVADATDNCPDIKGLITNGGCPKSDAILEDQYAYDAEIAAPTTPTAVAKTSEILPADREMIANAMEQIYFESGSKKLQSRSFSVLDQVAEMLERNPDYQLDITGHTDNTGSEKDNVVLSIQRAFEVKYYLAHQKGVRLARITSDGKADEKPVSDNMTEEGRKLNRRVEFRLYKAGSPKNIADNS